MTNDEGKVPVTPIALSDQGLQNGVPGKQGLPCYNSRVSSPAFADPCEENLRLNHQEYQEQKLVLDSFPYHIQIGGDNRCNLRCGFCLAAAYREQGKLHIQDRRLEHNAFEIFQRLKPTMKYWKFLSITGPGESLLNPRLGEILDLVRSQSQCVIVITTNGVLIKRKMAELFVRHGVQEVSISMDSIHKEMYEELRVNARYEDVLAAIDHLKQARQELGSDSPRINLTPNFMTLNIRELPEFIDFALEKGIDAIQATPTQIYRSSWVDRSLLHHPDLTRRMAKKAETLAEEKGIRFINGLKMVYVNRGRLSFLRKREPVDFSTDPSECQKPWMSLYIEPDGEVRPCCYQSPIYGNLLENDFEQLWNSQEAQALRQGMIEKDLPQACRDCYEFNRHDPSIMVQT